jgi:hypothetical protein
VTGYRPEDEAKDAGSSFELKTFSFLLLAPLLIGLFLLIDGLGGGSPIKAVIGALLLASAPFIARWTWRGGMWK